MGFLDDVKKSLGYDDKESVAENAREKADEAQAKAPAPAAKRTYVVKKGDTLSGIGEKYGVSDQKIAMANNIDNPDLIFPGQRLIIPD